MTQEEKELLLKDLTARLPYNVEVDYNNSVCEVLSIDKYNEELGIWKSPGYSPIVKLEEVKPYLFPLSSMTEEQKQEYQYITERWMYDSSYSISDSIDWLNKNNFDYRGLIPMGLALDATNKNIY